MLQPPPAALAVSLRQAGATQVVCIKVTKPVDICTYHYNGLLVEIQATWVPSRGKFHAFVVRHKKLAITQESGPPA